MNWGNALKVSSFEDPLLNGYTGMVVLLGSYHHRYDEDRGYFARDGAVIRGWVCRLYSSEENRWTYELRAAHGSTNIFKDCPKNPLEHAWKFLKDDPILGPLIAAELLGAP